MQDQIGHLGTTKETRAKIQPRVLLEHQPQTLPRRFIKAVLALDIGQQLWVQAACGAGLSTHGLDMPASYRPPHTNALQARDGLLHRATRCGLHNHEVDQQNAQQGRHNQQQTPQAITPHGNSLR